MAKPIQYCKVKKKKTTKKNKRQSIGRDVEKHLKIVSGKQNGTTAIENGIKIPQKITIRIIMIQQCLLHSVYVCTYI